MLKRAAALLLALALTAALCLSAAADHEGFEAPADSQRLRVYFDGLLSCTGYACGSEYYLPLSPLCMLKGIRLSSTPAEDGALHIKGMGFELSALSGQEYLTANGRYVYAPGGVFLLRGELYIPLITAERIFGIHLRADAEKLCLYADTHGLSLIDGGEEYYSALASVEDYFWLSRIIYAEAGQQSMEAMLAVGQVVLNRLEDSRFPSTVFAVVFDRNGGMQFTPVENGSVYYEPSPAAQAAAYMCYEGYDIVGDSLYFVNPTYGNAGWFSANKVYFATVGNHDFYVDG